MTRILYLAKSRIFGQTTGAVAASSGMPYGVLFFVGNGVDRDGHVIFRIKNSILTSCTAALAAVTAVFNTS
jgi:hypothetical protein